MNQESAFNVTQSSAQFLIVQPLTRIGIATFIFTAAACGASDLNPSDGGMGDASVLDSVVVVVDGPSLACTVPGLQGRLSTPCVRTECPSGNPACPQPVCPLDIDSDGNILGACPVPTGALCDFRIEYYADLSASSNQLILATSFGRIDLRSETRPRVMISFADLNTDDFDRDSDGRSNVAELCAGTDPETPD